MLLNGVFSTLASIGLVMAAAVPDQLDIITASPMALAKRQQGATYAGTCVYYTGLLLGGDFGTRCNDAAGPGAFVVQTCAVLDIGLLNPICQQPVTASSCTTANLFSQTSKYVYTNWFGGGYMSYYSAPYSTTSCSAQSYPTRPVPVVVTPTPAVMTTTKAPSSTLAPQATSTLAPTTTSKLSIPTSTTSVIVPMLTSTTATPATSSTMTSLIMTTSSIKLTSSSSLPFSSSTGTTSIASSSIIVTTSSALATSARLSSSSALMIPTLASTVPFSSSSATPASSSSSSASRVVVASSVSSSPAASSSNSSSLTTSAVNSSTVAASSTRGASIATSASGVSSTFSFSGSSTSSKNSQLLSSSLSSPSRASSVFSLSASAAPTAGLPRIAKNGALYIGCFQDGIDQRTLQQRTNDVNKIEECVSQCGSAGFDRAGVEYYTQCFCGYASAGYNGQPQIDDGICSVPCNDPTQTCGNGNAMQIYAIPEALVNPSPAASTPTPTPSPTAGLPRLSRNGGQYLGCFRDDINQRALPVRVGDVGTVEACISSCQSAGYALAGLEYFYQCFCGNGGTNGQPQIDDGSCNAPCNDDKSETCGGDNAIQLYSVPQGAGAPAIPTTVTTSSGTGAYQGCYSDNVNYRTLPNRVADVGSVDQCVNSCANAGYAFAGIEYTRECYCGNAVRASIIDNAQCQKYTCTENSSQKCGGDSAIQVYSVQSASAPPAATGNWSYVGCLQDFYPNPRTLQGYSLTSNSMTQQFCKSTCQAKGFTYAGVEYSGECYCDNQIHNNPQTLTSCAMACSGDSSQLCGGSNAIQVYTLNALSSSTGSSTAAPDAAVTSVPGSPSIVQITSNGASFKGCYTDSVNARALRNRMADVRGGDPIASCMSACKSAGYTLGAVEYGHECFCDTSINNGQSLTTNEACDMVCDGNSLQYCGNGNIAQVYDLQVG